MFDRIHHIAFAIRDMDNARTLVEETFGLDCIYTKTMTEDFNLDIAIYFAGDSLVELISPRTRDGFTHEFIEANGPGFFHVAFEVDDIQRRMDELRAKGLEFGDDDPRPGPDDAWKVATLQDETLGMLQIVEQPTPLEDALGLT